MKELTFNIFADDIEMEGEEIRGIFNNYYYADTNRFITNSDFIFELNKESEKIIENLRKYKNINDVIKNINENDYFVYIENGYIILEWNCHFISAYGKYKWKINKINFGAEHI